MKKFFICLLTVCIICACALSASAYNAVDGGGWVEGIAVDTENGIVTLTFSDAFISDYAPNGYRGAVFTQKPTLETQGDAGFWVIYRGAEGTDELGQGTLAGGFYGGGAVYQLDASELEEGKTYYLTLTGNNAALSPDWTWTQHVFSFVYASEQNQTADYSGFIYAFAAVAGCGALLLLAGKKRLSGEKEK